MATPTDICNMAISRLGQPKINDISENSAAAIACRDHFEPVRDALLRGHPWNFATTRADLAEGDTPAYGWSRSFTLPDDFLRLNTVNGVEASRCEADYSLTFRTIYSNADTLQVTYVKRVEDTTLFDPLFIEAFVLKLAAAIAPSIADPTEKGAMEGLAASRLRDAAFADASENRSMISTTVMGAASRYYRPQAVAFDAWGPSVGIKGGDGWTPLISLVNDAGREVVYVYDWTGGDGIAPKPGIGYVGRYGIVSNIADGVSIRGPVGPTGLTGPNSISTATLSEITGILKGAAGNVAAAVSGVDYAPPVHDHAGQSLGPIDKLSFDTVSPGTLVNPGEVVWNATEETLDLQLHGFVVHTGQHLIYHVQNNTGATIPKGTPVMFAGTTGNSGKLRIKPWNGIGPATTFMGLTGEAFVQGHEGSVVAFGKVRGIQTDGGNYGETWVNEDVIYGSTTAGYLTKTAPTIPSPLVEVMAVVSAHHNNGTVFVRPTHSIGTHAAATVSGNGISISGQQISLSIGTGATQVAAGSHASQHVTGGGDKIRDATASQDGLMTSTYAAKLDSLQVHKGQLGITIDGAGASITSGVKGYVRVPYNCTITKAEMVANDTGTVTVQVWKDSYAAFPPTSADAIYLSTPPNLTSNFKSTDSTLSGWTTSLSEGEYLAFNVPSASTGSLTRVTLTLAVTRTS
jgi:hypothetical protein